MHTGINATLARNKLTSQPARGTDTAIADKCATTSQKPTQTAALTNNKIKAQIKASVAIARGSGKTVLVMNSWPNSMTVTIVCHCVRRGGRIIAQKRQRSRKAHRAATHKFFEKCVKIHALNHTLATTKGVTDTKTETPRPIKAGPRSAPNVAQTPKTQT